jgi:hypothetical protein
MAALAVPQLLALHAALVGLALRGAGIGWRVAPDARWGDITQAEAVCDALCGGHDAALDYVAAGLDACDLVLLPPVAGEGQRRERWQEDGAGVK